MHGRPQELLKNFYRNTIFLLKQKYDQLEVVYIGFNHQEAVELSEKDFYGDFLNGGDEYILGWKKGDEVLSRAKYTDYDKYAVLAGDFQTRGGDDVQEAMVKMIEKLNYGAVVQTVINGDVGHPEILDPLKAYMQTNKWFDHAELEDSPASQIKVLQHFFGKGRDRDKK
jgi:uncharacterized sporulation protein YeaH/YhbH (DUF444 family)